MEEIIGIKRHDGKVRKNSIISSNNYFCYKNNLQIKIQETILEFFFFVLKIALARLKPASNFEKNKSAFLISELVPMRSKIIKMVNIFMKFSINSLIKTNRETNKIIICSPHIHNRISSKFKFKVWHLNLIATFQKSERYT